MPTLGERRIWNDPLTPKGRKRFIEARAAGISLKELAKRFKRSTEVLRKIEREEKQK